MRETDRSRDRSDEEETSPEAAGGKDTESRGTKRGQGEELKEVMKIRRSRKGAYDMRMRRSTRKTGALILDLVTLTPAGVPLPAYYMRLRTHRTRCSRQAQRNAESGGSHTFGAYSTCTSRSRSSSSSLTHGCEMRERWMLTRLLPATR